MISHQKPVKIKYSWRFGDDSEQTRPDDSAKHSRSEATSPANPRQAKIERKTPTDSNQAPQIRANPKHQPNQAHKNRPKKQPSPAPNIENVVKKTTNKKPNTPLLDVRFFPDLRQFFIKSIDLLDGVRYN